MRFKIDENLPVGIAALLREAGHSVDTVFDEALSGASDAVIARSVQREERTLLTLDIGFGDIRAYPPADYSGIIVLRGKTHDRASLSHLVTSFLPLLEVEPLIGHLWIVEADRVRIV